MPTNSELDRIVIGDIHGHSKMLAALLEYHGPHKHYIFLGDYIDRGPDSRGVVNLILNLPHKTALLGNHEQLFMRVMKGPRPAENYSYERYKAEKAAWLTPVNGGQSTLRSFHLDSNATWNELDQRYQNFFEGLKFYHEDPDAVFVHAGLAPKQTLEEQSLNTLLWIRDAWVFGLQDYLGKTVYFGHTITRNFPALCNSQGLIYKKNCVGLDTSAYHTGVLTSIALDEGPRPHVYQYVDYKKRVIGSGPIAEK